MSLSSRSERTTFMFSISFKKRSRPHRHDRRFHYPLCLCRTHIRQRTYQGSPMVRMGFHKAWDKVHPSGTPLCKAQKYICSGLHITNNLPRKQFCQRNTKCVLRYLPWWQLVSQGPASMCRCMQWTREGKFLAQTLYCQANQVLLPIVAIQGLRSNSCPSLQCSLQCSPVRACNRPVFCMPKS